MWKVAGRIEVSLQPDQLEKILDQQFCRSKKVFSAEVCKKRTEQLEDIYPLPMMEVSGICRVKALTLCWAAACEQPRDQSR